MSLNKLGQLYSFAWGFSKGEASHILILTESDSLDTLKMSPLFTATTYTGISNGKMKSEEQGEDGDEVGRHFFSSYTHCRDVKPNHWSTKETKFYIQP